MIFTLVTAVQEKLNEIVDETKNRREEEKRQREREAEEAEKVPVRTRTGTLSWTSCPSLLAVFSVSPQQVAFQGTVVTIENFLAWKAKFEQEMAELRRKRLKEEEQSGKPKLTGKPVPVLPLPVCWQSD